MARARSPLRPAPGLVRRFAGRVAKILSSGGGWILSAGRRALAALRRRFARQAARVPKAVVAAPPAGSPPRDNQAAARPQGGGSKGASSEVGGDLSNSAPPANTNQAAGATKRKRNRRRQRNQTAPPQEGPSLPGSSATARPQDGGTGSSSKVDANSSNSAPHAIPNQAAHGDADDRLAAPTPPPPTGIEDDAPAAPEASTGMPPVEEDGEGPSSPTGARIGPATASADHAVLGEGALSQAGGDSSNAAPRADAYQAAHGDRLAAPTSAAPAGAENVVQEDGEEPPPPPSSPPRRSSKNKFQNAFGEGSYSGVGDAATSAPGSSSPRIHVQEIGGEGLHATAASSADSKGKAPLLEDDHEPSSSPPRRYYKNEFQNAFGEGSFSDVGDAATSAPGSSSTSTHAQEIGGEGLHATAASSADSKGKAPLLEDDHEPPSSPPRRSSKNKFQNAFGEGSSSDVFLQDEEGWTVVPIRKRKKKQPLEQGMGNISAAVPPRLMHQSLIHTGRKMLNGKARVDAKVKTRRQPLRRPRQWMKDKDSYYLDELFVEEVRDPELETHQMYLSKVSVCKKGFIPCLICFLNDPNEKEKLIERNNQVIIRHCRVAHQCEGIKCEKKGCLARAKTGHDIGIHQDVCFGIKKS